MKKFSSKKVWKQFVLAAFNNLRIYAEKYNNLTPEIDEEIDRVAALMARKVWNEEDGKITEWGVNRIKASVFNLDYKENLSLGRAWFIPLNDLIYKIEDDFEYSRKLDKMAAKTNGTFNIEILKI